MEFLDGATLKHLIGNQPLEFERVLDIGIEVEKKHGIDYDSHGSYRFVEE
jgi:hypothetical protein